MNYPRLSGLWLLAALTLGVVPDATSQNVAISGSVTSEDGRTVYPATVDIAQLNIVVPTNAQGRYTLTVKPTKKPGLAVMDLRQVKLTPVSGK